MFNKKYTIVKNEEVIPGHRLMCLNAPEIASRAAPGQFLHLRCGDGQDPILRRPLSIHFADRGRVYILYRIAGRGTSRLALMARGDIVDVMGPLGRGFTLPAPGERVAVVGGGIGAAPLFFLLKKIGKIYGKKKDMVRVFLGASTLAMVPGAAQIRKMGFPLDIAADDGSGDFKGTVVDMFRKEAKNLALDRVYACGPPPMIRALAGAVGPDPAVEVSVEERMGCGVGACLSCACKVRAGEGEGFGYARVCTDGPVFDLRKLVL
ncbi:MAG: dihydroorotate dehydrogenase electron transfer subunit [Peptococcaceae bacterium]|nr:dihydroorotate dehydrogenase electron transfer subunit [Peptococcaceae bacterium]